MSVIFKRIYNFGQFPTSFSLFFLWKEKLRRIFINHSIPVHFKPTHWDRNQSTPRKNTQTCRASQWLHWATPASQSELDKAFWIEGQELKSSLVATEPHIFWGITMAWTTQNLHRHIVDPFDSMLCLASLMLIPWLTTWSTTATYIWFLYWVPGQWTHYLYLNLALTSV